MIYRQTNNENGYQLRNLTERGYLSYDRYPKQKTDYLNKYILIRYKSEYYQELNQRFHIPEGYYDDYIYPENSGLRNLFFRIIRWDETEPFRAILINKLGHVIVTYTYELEESIYDLNDSMILKATESYCNRKNLDYLKLNETDDPDLFFDKLYYEKVKVYPVQKESMIGLRVYSEYDNDLKLDRSEDVLQYKNRKKFKLSEIEIWEMIERNPKLYGLTDEVICSFPSYYNPHIKTKIDESRRAINIGYVIRADVHDYIEPEFVVMEYLSDSIRFVTQHEANFFYRIEDLYDKNKLITKETDMRPIVDLLEPYLAYINPGQI